MIRNLLQIQTDISNFWVFNWYYVFAVFAAIISIIIAYKNFKKKPKDSLPPIQDNNNSAVNTNTININYPNTENKEQDNLNSDGVTNEIKKTTNILFIDDDTKFSIVKILKNEGWDNTKSITDLKSYGDAKLVSSQIVFVDIQGVGKLLECKEEGLGLALHIKNQYPHKKVIIYSAIQSHKLFHEAIKKVDFLLSKDAEPIQFISLVEKYSLEVR